MLPIFKTHTPLPASKKSVPSLFIKHLEEVGIEDVPEVGGKNASLGEMLQELMLIGISLMKQG